MQRACVNDGCDRTDIVGRGMCNNCYYRWLRAAHRAGPLPPAKPKPRCGVEGCERPHYGNGWCRPHGRSFKTHGDPLHSEQHRLRREGACAIEGCDRPVRSSGLCGSHYARNFRHGDPTAGKGAALRHQVAAAVADPHADRSQCWTHLHGRNGRPYVSLETSQRLIPLARYVLFLVNGDWPVEACHKCDNERCWNPDHLYAGTRDTNMDDAARRGRTRKSS